METKTLHVEVKDEAKGIALVRFATLGVKDKDGDVIERGAIGRQKVKVSAYGHTSWAGALPVGVGETREEGSDALGDLRFFMDTAGGRETFATLRGLGSLAEYSFGFDITEEGRPSEEQRAAGVQRVLKKLAVHEVSPVLRGAGVGTATLALKCDTCAAKAGALSADEIENAQLEMMTARVTLRQADRILHGNPFGPDYRQDDAAAEKLATFAADAGLRLLRFAGGPDLPGIHWFPSGSHGPRILGLADRERRAIAMDLDLKDEVLAEVVLHEVSHAVGHFDEPKALAFGRLWSPVVMRAYRFTKGQSHLVRVRDSVPGFPRDPEARLPGRLTISRPERAGYTFLPKSAGSSWQRVA